MNQMASGQRGESRGKEDYEPNKVVYYLVNEAKNQYVKTYPFLFIKS